MGVSAQSDGCVGVTQQAAIADPDLFGALERQVPLGIDVFRRVQPRLSLAVEAHVRPGLMGVTRKQKALGYTEVGVVGAERVGRGTEILEARPRSGWALRRVGRGQKLLRMAQRSGKTGWESVVVR